MGTIALIASAICKVSQDKEGVRPGIRGVSASVHAGIHNPSPGRHLLPPTATAADGTSYWNAFLFYLKSVESTESMRFVKYCFKHFDHENY